MNLLIYIIGIITVAIGLLLVLSPFYFIFGIFKWFYHGILGWHTPAKNEGMTYDGCNIHSKCKHCHQEIIQDSQGNWFVP